MTFPVNPEFASLNIAQAVLLMSYEWMKSGLEAKPTRPLPVRTSLPAEKHHLQGLLDHLEAALEARGYFRPAAKKPKMVDNLRAVLTRPGFTEAEIKVLRGVACLARLFLAEGAARRGLSRAQGEGRPRSAWRWR